VTSSLRQAADLGCAQERLASVNPNVTLDQPPENQTGSRTSDSSSHICWNEKLQLTDANAKPGTAKEDRLIDQRNSSLSLLTAILRGPLPNLCNGILHARILISLFNEMKSSRIDHNCPSVYRPLMHCRILLYVLLCVRDLSKTQLHPRLFEATIALLVDAATCIESFYAFYLHPTLQRGWNSSSAPGYAEEWVHLVNSEALQSRMRTTFPEAIKTLDNIFKTWCCFPALPQIRPVPFGDTPDQKSEQQDEECSKNFSRKHKTFTPDILLFLVSRF